MHGAGLRTASACQGHWDISSTIFSCVPRRPSPAASSSALAHCAEVFHELPTVTPRDFSPLPMATL